jgi:hypothetical protein
MDSIISGIVYIKVRASIPPMTNMPTQIMGNFYGKFNISEGPIIE